MITTDSIFTLQNHLIVWFSTSKAVKIDFSIYFKSKVRVSAAINNFQNFAFLEIHFLILEFIINLHQLHQITSKSNSRNENFIKANLNVKVWADNEYQINFWKNEIKLHSDRLKFEPISIKDFGPFSIHIFCWFKKCQIKI